MNLFTRNSPYYHLLQYLLSLLKHPVYTCVLQNTGTYSVIKKDGLSFFFWLLPQMSEDSEDFIFQQDEAPPPLAPGCSDVFWMNLYLSVGKKDLALQFRPPRSPDFTPCDFFLWGFVNETVCVPSLPTTLDGLKKDLTLQFRPPRSPDLTPCDFFLWGFVKETVCVPSLPTTLDGLKKDLALQFWPPRSPDLIPCDFFLWGSVNETVCVPSLPTTLDGLKKNPYQNYGELSDARHSSSGVERTELPSRCYPCGRRGGPHWTFINFIASIIKYNLHRICH